MSRINTSRQPLERTKRKPLDRDSEEGRTGPGCDSRVGDAVNEMTFTDCVAHSRPVNQYIKINMVLIVDYGSDTTSGDGLCDARLLKIR